MKLTHVLPLMVLAACGGTVDADFQETITDAPESRPSVEVPDVEPAAPSGELRGLGLDFTPVYVSAYDPSKDIPANALDASAYSSLDAWLDDLVAKDVPGKIRSGNYTVEGTERVAPRGIYGYGTTMPVITATSRAAWLFVHSRDLVIRYVGFKNFGTVAAASRPTTPLKDADGKIDSTPYHSGQNIMARVWVSPVDGNPTRTMTRVAKMTLSGVSGSVSKVNVTRPIEGEYEFGVHGTTAAIEETFDILGKTVRFTSSLEQTASAIATAISGSGKGYTAYAEGVSVIIEKATKHGLSAIAVTASGLGVEAEATGPSIDIQHCNFVDVDIPLYALSDTTATGRVDYSANTHTGTWGGVYLNATRWTKLYAGNNVWKDATGSRAQPSITDNGTNTLIGLGTNAWVYTKAQSNVVLIENNEVSNIESVQMRTDANAAVMADIRNGYPEKPGALSVSFNTVKHYVNLRGHEDTNVVYGKVSGIIIERNVFDDFGAGNMSAAGYEDGSETNGILIKEPGGIQKGDIIIRGNTLANAPANIGIIKVMDFVGYLEVSFNTIRSWDATNLVAGSGAIKTYGPLGKVAIFGNTFVDTPVKGFLINLHEAEGLSDASQLRIDNNTATGAYTKNAALIRVGQELSSGFLDAATLGSNTLVNGTKTYVMQLVDDSGDVASQSAHTVPAETYTPPTE